MTANDFDDAAVFVISVVAELTGMHAQTLRQYDRLGLVTPQRTAGGGRRYSTRDVERVREIQRLSGEGVGLAGIQRILDLENEVDALRRRVWIFEFRKFRPNVRSITRLDHSSFDHSVQDAVGGLQVLFLEIVRNGDGSNPRTGEALKNQS